MMSKILILIIFLLTPVITKAATHDYVIKYAREFGAPEAELMDVGRCESNFKNISGDGGASFGPFQYNKNTFNSFAKEMGEKLDYKNPEHQAKLTAWVFKHRPQYKRHWTTWRALQNGGVYTFTAKGKKYTVKCFPQFKLYNLT